MTTLAPRRLLDATSLHLIRVPALPHRDFCHAGCPTWINDTGCDCPPYLWTTGRPYGA